MGSPKWSPQAAPVRLLTFSISPEFGSIRRCSSDGPAPCGRIPHSARVARIMVKSSVLAAPMAADAPVPSLPVCASRCAPGSGRPTVYEVGDGGFLVGSVPGCDLRLPGANLPPVLCPSPGMLAGPVCGSSPQSTSSPSTARASLRRFSTMATRSALARLRSRPRWGPSPRRPRLPSRKARPANSNCANCGSGKKSPRSRPRTISSTRLSSFNAAKYLGSAACGDRGRVPPANAGGG